MFECWNIFAFEIRSEVTNILVTRGNIWHGTVFIYKKNESYIFKHDVKVFCNRPYKNNFIFSVYRMLNCIKFSNSDERLSLREKCLYLELFWPVFQRIWTECGKIKSISQYSVRMRENTDKKNTEYGHFSRSVSQLIFTYSKSTIENSNGFWHVLKDNDRDTRTTLLTFWCLYC